MTSKTAAPKRPMTIATRKAFDLLQAKKQAHLTNGPSTTQRQGNKHILFLNIQTAKSLRNRGLVKFDKGDLVVPRAAKK